MKQEIRFKGLTLNRDEMSAQPGEMSLCGNMELHDGSLRPAVIKGTKIAGGAELTGKLLYVHQTNTDTCYISVSGNDLKAYKAGSGSYTSVAISGNVPNFYNIKEVKSVGNTLIVSDNNGIWYLLYKSDSYHCLGQQPPFIDLQFGLSDASSEYDWDDYKVAFSTSANDMFNRHADSTTAEIIEQYQSVFTDAAYSLINKLHSEITEKNHFYAPFVVRYCYRMYDGTRLFHSAPIYLPVSTPHQDFIKVEGLLYDGMGGIGLSGDANRISLKTPASSLRYKLVNGNDYQALQDWSDIVSSIDVYISQPMPRTKQDELFKTVSCRSANGLTERLTNTFDYKDYRDDSLNDVLANIPEWADGEMKKTMLHPIFFLVRSFNLDYNLPTSMIDFPLESASLKNLATLSQMPDDYHSHKLILGKTNTDPARMFVYNHRLHVFDFREQLFSGFIFATLAPYLNYGSYYPGDLRYVDKVIVYIDTVDGEKVVYSTQSPPTSIRLSMLELFPLFYPDSNATKMVLRVTEPGMSTYGYVTMKMNPAPNLEGAFTDLSYTESSTAVNPSLSNEVVYRNKIYVSKVDNPFYFPAESRQTVGFGEILGLAIVTRALSPGQVGTHNLTVFSTEGLWVMEVNTEGKYTNAHFMANDVCVNANSICQLSQSVAFATSSGLSRFVESDVLPISEELDGPFFDIRNLLSDFYNAYADQDYQETYDAQLEKLLDFNTVPQTYFDSGRVVFDFTGSRILVLPSNTSSSFVALVYSIRDKAWSTVYMDSLKSVVTDFAYPYLQSGGGSVTRLDKPYDYKEAATGTPPTVPHYQGLVVTRTLTFSDTRDVLKAFQQLCNCPGSRMPLLWFYGSNNQLTWTLIGKTARSFYSYMPGHPFRWFRIAMHFDMQTNEKYQALALDIINKYAKL